MAFLGGQNTGSAQYTSAPAEQQAALANTNTASTNLSNPLGSQDFTNAQTAALGGIGQQQQLANALQAQNGIGNQNAVYGQLQGIANGTGPNPALAQLNQTTGQNIQNQAALMAGQRGAGANAGLLARQAAEQGGANQQQAAGQAATLAAQQQLGAIGQAGGIAGQQVANQMGATQGLNQLLQGQQGLTLQGLGTQNQQALQNTAQQNSAIQANNQNQLAQMGMLNQYNMQNTQGQNTFNSAMAEANTKQQGDFWGKAIGSIGQAGALAGMYSGGKVSNPKLAAVSPSHRYPEHIGHVSAIYHGNKFGDVGHMPKFAWGGMAGGSQVSMKQGGNVPGQAKMPGDHPANDTVPAKLSPGEVVIPKSVMESDDPVNGAAQFVAAIQKKKGSDSGNHENDFKEALGRAIKGRKKKAS